MSEKKWPILDNRKDQLSKQRPKKAIAWFSVPDTLAVTNSVDSGNGRPKLVCHLFSSCEHASITSKSDSKAFEFSDEFQRRAIVREGGNCRVTFAEEDHDFCFVSAELEPFETCIVIELFSWSCRFSAVFEVRAMSSA